MASDQRLKWMQERTCSHLGCDETAFDAMLEHADGTNREVLQQFLGNAIPQTAVFFYASEEDLTDPFDEPTDLKGTATPPPEPEEIPTMAEEDETAGGVAGPAGLVPAHFLLTAVNGEAEEGGNVKEAAEEGTEGAEEEPAGAYSNASVDI